MHVGGFILDFGFGIIHGAGIRDHADDAFLGLLANVEDVTPPESYIPPQKIWIFSVSVRPFD